MKIFTRLDATIGSEIVSLTMTIMTALSSIIFLFKLITYADYFMTSSEGIMTFGMFFVFLFPGIFKVTVPISLFLASIVVTLRMGNARETEAWLASGVSIMRLSVMPFFVGMLACILALISSLYFEPYSRQEWRKFKWMHARKSVEVILENKMRPKTFVSGLFSTSGSDIAFYSDEVSDDRHDLKNVFLAFRAKDGSPSSIIKADTGALKKEVRDGLPDYVLHLRNGNIFSPQIRPGTTSYDWTLVDYTGFEISLVNLFQRQFDPGGFDADDMRSLTAVDYFQLMQKQKKYPMWGIDPSLARDHTFFYEQIAVPLACLLLPIIGLCLGIQDPRKKQGYVYAGVALVLFFYYSIIMICQHYARKYELLPEATIVLGPSALLLCTLILLRWRRAYPPGVTFFEFVKLELLFHKRQLVGLVKR